MNGLYESNKCGNCNHSEKYHNLFNDSGCDYYDCSCGEFYPLEQALFLVDTSKKKRLDTDEYWLGLVIQTKLRGTCPRRQCSAIIVDDENHIVSSGYNGTPKNLKHCIDTPCPGVGDTPGQYQNCIAVHAEANALLQAGDRLRFAKTIYCSTQPCFDCSKLICQTNIRRVVYMETYADTRGAILLEQAGITSEFKKLFRGGIS